MIKFRSIFLLSVIIILPFVLKGQISRQQAINLVLDQILVSDTGYVNLYCSYDTIPNTINIALANGNTVIPHYPGNWVFFSDDKPFANWDHSSRFIFVDSQTGDYNIYSSLSFPFDLLFSYQTLSSVTYPCPADCYHSYATSPPYSLHIIPTNTNPHLHAVLVNGIDRLDPQWGSCTCNFDFDIAMVYNALEEYGYKTHYNPPPIPPDTLPNESNVIVLYDDGSKFYPYAGKTGFHNDWDGYPCHNFNCGYHEIDGPATKTKILEVFSELSVGGTSELSPEDQLFVYITGNGHLMSNQEAAFECYHAPISPPTSSDYITTSDLRNAVKNINCAQIIFVMQQNYSGKFIDPLITIPTSDPPLCKNRLVFSATGNGSSSYPKTDSYKELWMHCGNIDEFTYYFVAALRGHYEARFPWELFDYPSGEFPFNHPIYGPPWATDGCSSAASHPIDYHPDSGTPPYSTIVPGNNDGYIQLVEAFNYAKCMDTWCPEGYLNQRQHMEVKDTTFPPLPPPPVWIPWNTNVNCSTDFETPMMGVSNGFGTDTLYCLNGIAGKTKFGSGIQTILGGRSYLLGGTVNIHSNCKIETNAEIIFGVDNAHFIVDANSTFTVDPELTLIGSGTDNMLKILNFNNILNLKKVDFTSVSLENYSSTLNIGDPNNPSSFTNCANIGSRRGFVTVTNSTFNNSTLNLQGDMSLTDKVIVDKCIFNGTIASDGCRISDYKKYSITDNIITQGGYGLHLTYLGSASGDHLVRNNHISGCYAAGICLYASEAVLNQNHIENVSTLNGLPGKGLEVYNYSNVSMTGNANALKLSQTQEINDCDGLEFYATQGCLPYYMKYNAFIDDNNISGDPIFFYDNSQVEYPTGFSIGYNCWGNNFDPSQDLKVSCGQLWPYPTWCPTSSIINIPPDEDMYKTALNDVDSNMYTEAKNVFKLLIETYPESVYAQAAMKALYQTESYADNDWSGLQMYYLTNDSVLADTTLTKLGDYLANHCDIQMHNYENAIAWYENEIQNAPDPNDSVFAIIDLGHLYSTMDTTGNRPIFIGTMPQYKPTSQARYVAYRDSLISLLPFKKSHFKRGTPRSMSGQLLKIVPNPSNSATEFYVKLSGAKNADIKIYNSWGKLERTILFEDFNDGLHRIIFNTSDLASGIYECMLNVSEKRTDLKKLIVVK